MCVCVCEKAKLENKTPSLVINYKLLNKVLRWIQYPIKKEANNR